jgi:hypothetical protein
MPCDLCDAYHSFGYDECPACPPDRPHADPRPPTTDALLHDLAEQLAQALEDGQVALPQVRAWLVLVQRARQRLP